MIDNNVKTKSGMPLIIIGVLFLVVSIAINIVFVMTEELIPEDAEWYKATVKEIVSVDEDYVTKTKNGEKVKKTEYDIEYIIEYDVEGNTHEVLRRDLNRSTRIYEGDVYYVKVSPKQPEYIYKQASSPKDGTGFFFIVFYAIGGVMLISGIVTQIKNIRAKRAMAY